MENVYIYYCRNAAKPETRPGVVLEAVPCTGRLDPRYILKAFEGGAKGVCILGCPKGECKSFEGNLRALVRVEAAQELLAEAGAKPNSLKIILLGDSSDGAKARAIADLSKFLDEVMA